MAVTIKSGATSDELTIDSTGAARFTLYDTAGNELNAPVSGSYLANINFRHTAADAANSTMWTMRNGATKTVYIRTIFLTTAFDGTAAASTLRYSVQRFTTATPTGGSAITIIKKNNSFGASTVADIRQGGPLTTTSVVFENDAMTFGMPISVTNGIIWNQVYLDQPNQTYANFELAANEGLAIRVNSAQAAVIGWGMYGFVEWHER